MTIGNLPKEIHRKPSRQGYILLGYISATKLSHIANKAGRRRALLNLTHAALGLMLEPLKNAGLNGLDMASGDGETQHCHSILAAHIGDYLEQIVVACIKFGECAQCSVPRNELGNFDDDYAYRDLDEVLKALALVDISPTLFCDACKEAGIKPVVHPYWENLPYCDIFLSITPDILHQLYQGLIKHLFNWIKHVYTSEELDAQCKCLPRNHHLRHFFNGVTPLSQLTGREHSDISRILLRLIIDIALPGKIQYYYFGLLKLIANII